MVWPCETINIAAPGSKISLTGRLSIYYAPKFFDLVILPGIFYSLICYACSKLKATQNLFIADFTTLSSNKLHNISYLRLDQC